MKKSRIVILVAPLLCLPGCLTQKKIPPIDKPVVAPVTQMETPAAPVQPKKVAFTASLFTKRRVDGTIVPKTTQEIIKTIDMRLLATHYLAAAQHMLLSKQYSIKDKILVLKEMQKLTSEQSVQEVLAFFENIVTENQEYLTAHPFVDINTSLVSPSPDSSEFIKDHPEISSVIWTLEELYSQGNTLLQEAVRRNNVATVQYLLAQGATPRYLEDPRGPVLALEWADKHGYADVAHQLTKDINILRDTKTTLLDELLYQDPNAARLVRKYGGKTAVELS